MRVSSETLFRTASSAMQHQNGKLLDLQTQVASGRRFQHAHEAPADAVQVLGWEAAEQRLAAQADAAARVQHRLGMSENALDDAQVMLDRVREQLLAGRSASYSPEDRARMADAVQGIASDWLLLANRQDGTGQFLFSGSATGTPFDASGTYVGSTTERQVEVADGQRVPDGVSGDQVFGDALGQTSFAWLQAAEASLREADPTLRNAGLDAALQGLDAVAQQTSRARTDIGNRLNALDRAATWRDSAQAQLTQSLSQTRDTDVIDVATRLAQLTAQQSAAQATYLQISSLSLFDRLR